MHRLRLYVTTIATAYVLTTRVPHPVELAGHFGSPRAWIAAVGPDTAAAATAGALLWLLAAWVAFGLAAGAVSLLPGEIGRLGHAVACRVTPVAVRRLVVTAAGTSILMSPVTAFAAAPTGAPALPSSSAPAAPGSSAALPSGNSAPALPGSSASTAPGSSAVLPSVGWPTDPAPGSSAVLPSVGWPTDPAPGSTAVTAPGGRQGAPPRPHPRGTTERVTVRPGDSLWSLAAHRLGRAGSPARIQAEWPRWYQANRQVVGEDPDLLRPGTSLRAPGPTGTETAG